MPADPQLDQAWRRRMRYAERKLRDAQRRLSRAERASSIGPGYLPTSGMSELAPSNIRYGRRKWTKRRTELRWGGHPFRQKRGKNGAPGDSFLTQERAGGLTPP